jgi:peptide/nickel transport system permease protein
MSQTATIADASLIAQTSSEKLYRASQWRLMAWKLRKHKLAMAGLVTLIVLYLTALLAPFLAPYPPQERSQYLYMPPQPLRFIDPAQPGLRPFVYGVKQARDPESLALRFTTDSTQRYYIRLFVHVAPYKILGIIPGDVHLFGVDEGMRVAFLGTDEVGRDLFSRALIASQLSLSIGLVGVALSFILGVFLGGISGYYGGRVDTMIQQTIIFLSSLPTIPIWMGLSAALPPTWPPAKTYFGITIILSIVGWTGLARVVRGRMLQLREENFVVAARLAGSRDGSIIFGHLLPSSMSYLIVSITLAVPGMILGETTLSFLGLGLREPAVSWGVLLQQAQNVRTVALHPWLMLPAVLVIVTALAFNFLGDGLRDAADPYAH